MAWSAELKADLTANAVIYTILWLLLPKDCCASCTGGGACQSAGELGPGLPTLSNPIFISPSDLPSVAPTQFNVNR